MTAQDSEISSLQSNLTEGFDTVLSTQEFRCDLSGSQDADSMSGEERLIQHNMGEVQVRRITITQAITLLLRNPLVRGDPRQSGQRALWRWCFIPALSAHHSWAALGSLLARELINISAEHLAEPWEAAKHKEHKEGKNQSLIPSFRSHS